MNMKKALPLLVIASMMLALLPSAFFAQAALTAPTTTPSPAVGVKGDTIKVVGHAGDVNAGTSVQLYWDTTTGAWDGTKGLMNSTLAASDGSYEIWFNIPESTHGAHYAWVVSGSGNVAVTVTVNAKVSLSSNSGLPSDSIIVTASGFGGSRSVQIALVAAVPPPALTAWPAIVAPAQPAPNTSPFLVGTGDGSTKTFTATITNHPVLPGSIVCGINHVPSGSDDALGAITGTDATYGAYTGSINYVTGAISFTFSTAPGNGLSVGIDYSYFTNTAGAGVYTLLATGTTNSLGTATVSVTVPAAAATGVYSMTVFDAKAVVGYHTFTVGPVITLSPVSGGVGEVIHISGRGFFPTAIMNKPVLARAGYTSDMMIANMPTGGVVVDANGRFRMDAVVSGGPQVIDDYTIAVTDSHGGVDTASASFEITALQTLAVTPVFASQGAQMTVSGTHWSKVSGTTVTVDLYDTTGTTIVVNIGTVGTLTDGSFSKVFTVPPQLENSYKILAHIIEVAPTDYTAKTIGFRIGTMGIQVSSSSGPTGKSISLTGNGFTKSGPWNATIGSKTLVSSASADANGLISQQVFIPSGLAAGTYTISVLDINADIPITVSFTVTYSTSITLTPNSAPNGFNVTIFGKGFKNLAGSFTATLYNKTSTGAADYIWTLNTPQNWGVIGAATVNGTGIVRAYWVVPDSTVIGAGNYYLNATDANEYNAYATFALTAKHIVATPRKPTFGVGDTISFQLEHTFGNVKPQNNSVIKIYDPSGVLVFAGDKLATWVQTGLWYTAPYSSQTSAGNPMVLASDAALGTWSYKWVDGNGDKIVNGTFAVAAAAPSPVQQQIIDLGKQLTDLKAQITGITTQITSIQTAATAAQNTATAAQTSAAAAKTSADAATTAATAAGTAANAAVTAANAAKTSADNAAAGTSGLTTLVYAAIGASLVAALAAIVALMQISRKIA